MPKKIRGKAAKKAPESSQAEKEKQLAEKLEKLRTEEEDDEGMEEDFDEEEEADKDDDQLNGQENDKEEGKDGTRDVHNLPLMQLLIPQSHLTVDPVCA